MLLLVPDVAGRIAAGKQVIPTTSPDSVSVSTLDAEYIISSKKKDNKKAPPINDGAYLLDCRELA